MNNIEKLAEYMSINGEKSILIHTIPGTPHWIVCQKRDELWELTLMQPMGNITYNLGTVNNEQHKNLWLQLIRAEIETKISQNR
jgi:hypothetical protein